MKLYYVQANDLNGENMDLFVHANSHTQAGEHWENHYEDWDFPPACKIYLLPVPRKGKSGAVNWDNELPFMSYTPRASNAEEVARQAGWYEHDGEWRKDTEVGYLYAASAALALQGCVQGEARRKGTK